MALKHSIKQDHFLPVALVILSLALMIGLSILSYLGTFSRHAADDYCFSRTLDESDNLIDATLTWYSRTSNRYTTMLLVGVTEWFGRSAIRYLPGLVIILWLVSLAWVLSRLAAKIRIPYPVLSGLTLAGMVVLYSILQAPNRYQSLYWRSGMVTYFTPLIAFSYLSGLLLTETWREQPRSKPMWIALLVWVWLGFFFAGGLSETTLAIQGGALGISILAVWFLTRGEGRKKALSLLFVALIASILALITVFLAPANALRVRAFGTSAQLTDVLFYSLVFAWDFIRETFRSLPTPTLASFVTAVLLGFGLYTEGAFVLKRKTLLSLMVLVPLTTYILIAFSMAPSYYGQKSYPGARSLMATRAVMVTGLLTFGLLAGMGLRMWANRLLENHRSFAGALVLLMTLFLALGSAYPLYAANRTLELLPWYRLHAEQWDARDQYIRQAVAEGATKLVVAQLDTMGGVQEYKQRARNWVNRCAADYYDLDRLRAPSAEWTAP